MNEMKEITTIASAPELIRQASLWFHEKWNIPVEAYRQSMLESIHTKTGVPAWYVMLDERQEILAGVGVIVNDFHRREDLTPNVCALYVEEFYRRQGIARKLLTHVCNELAAHGIRQCYLITGHTDLYEHYGWSFYGMIEEEDGSPIRYYQKEL